MIPYTRVFDAVAAALNTNSPSGAYTAQAESKAQYPEMDLVQAILNEEARIWQAIGTAVAHGRRVNQGGAVPAIIWDLVMNYGELVPSHIGPILSVEVGGVVYSKSTPENVTRLKHRNVLNLKLARCYALQDNRLLYTGTGQATVRWFDWERPKPNNLTEFRALESQLAPEYEGAWVDLSVGRVMPREGAYLQAAQGIYGRGLGLLEEMTGMKAE